MSKGEGKARGESDEAAKMQQELQNKYTTYKTLEANLANMNRQKELILSKLLEVQNTIISIDEMGKSESDVLFSIGSTAFAKGKPLDKNKVIVEVGAGIVLEKTVKEAKEILEARKSEIEKAVEGLQKEMERSAMIMQRLEADVQQMLMGAMSPGQQKGSDEKFRVISGG